MLKVFVKYLIKDERGQSMAEYGIILALIAVVCIGAFTSLGTTINGKIGDVVAGL